MTELERCIDFITGIADRAAMVKEPSCYGVAHLHPDLPSVWSRNYLFANENLDGATAESLAAETDRILGGLGLRHRKAELIDAKAGDRLERGFRELGWDSECDVIMVARRDPDRQVDTSIVDEVGLDDLAAAWTEGWRAEPRVESEDVVQQLVENRRVMADAVDTRFFAARVDGQIGSYCELYFDDRTGQIEDVLTLEPFRNRGLARATVMRALQESRAAGQDLTFLIADRDDWPKQLYAKLGFDEVGRIWEFLLPVSAAI
jgi:GNAT superfamily N-acetyltransferase